MSSYRTSLKMVVFTTLNIIKLHHEVNKTLLILPTFSNKYFHSYDNID